MRLLLLALILLALPASADVVDDVVGSVEGTASDLGDAVEDAGAGVSSAATSVGHALVDAVAGLGSGLLAGVQGLGALGAAASGAAASAILFVVSAGADGLTAIGAAASAGLAMAASGLFAGGKAAALALVQGMAWVATGTAQAVVLAASGLVAGIKAYLALLSPLRPTWMPPAAFNGAMVAGAAAGSTAAGWAGFEALRRWGLLGAGVAGFSRIQDNQVLDHPVRQEIFQLIQEHPGIHASQIARDVGAGWGTVTHHLDKLTKASLVAARRVNNQKCYFEQGGKVSRQDMAIAGALKGDTASQIAAFVTSHPMTSQKTMAESLGISAALASFHVKKLATLGVLEKVRHGKETLLTTSESMRRLMASGTDPVLAAIQQRGAMEFGS